VRDILAEGGAHRAGTVDQGSMKGEYRDGDA